MNFIDHFSAGKTKGKTQNWSGMISNIQAIYIKMMINTNFNDFQWVSQAISIILRNCQNTKNRIYTWIRTSNMLKWHIFRQKIMLQPPDIKFKLTFGVFCKSWFTLRFGRLNLEKHEIFANFPISRTFVIFFGKPQLTDRFMFGKFNIFRHQ